MLRLRGYDADRGRSHGGDLEYMSKEEGAREGEQRDFEALLSAGKVRRVKVESIDYFIADYFRRFLYIQVHYDFEKFDGRFVT